MNNSQEFTCVVDANDKPFALSKSLSCNNNFQTEEWLSASSQELNIMPRKDAEYCILREIVDQHKLETDYRKEKKVASVYRRVAKNAATYCICSVSCLSSVFFKIFPVFVWLPTYNCRENLISDIISGFTVSILHIPQGMAYGLLASVDAINGLYVSFFPLLIYFLMGTSRHISVGTFAVVSLMLSSIIEKLGAFSKTETIIGMVNTSLIQLNETKESYSPTYSNIEILTTVCLVTGGWQLLMGTFHLGTLTVLLSDNLVSGFSTGAAIHVATSQIRDLFDITVGKYGGPFKLVHKFKDIFKNLQYTNLATVIISAVAIFILAVVKEQINGRYRTRLKMPVPIDLIVVIIATVASYLGNFHGNYGVKIMGDIPTGLPHPAVPKIDLIPKVFADSLTVALVAFAITMSMAKIFVKKYKYDVDPNQELLALGSANVFSSFFLCYPCATSMSRSLVQERAGGKTQVAAVVSCCILLVVMLALGPLFYSLPKKSNSELLKQLPEDGCLTVLSSLQRKDAAVFAKCILSCIILVALKGMFIQVLDLIKAWKISIMDAMVWLVTFLSVVLIDVDYGLFIGIGFSVLTVLLQNIVPYQTVLGNLPHTDIYLDIKKYSGLQELSGVKIFHYGTALNFINRECFRSALLKHISSVQRDKEETNKKSSLLETPQVQFIIINCSSFSYIDTAGVEMLLEIIEDFREKDTTILLSCCSAPMIDMLRRTEFLTKITHPIMFPTIQDAVIYCKKLTQNIT